MQKNATYNNKTPSQHDTILSVRTNLIITLVPNFRSQFKVTCELVRLSALMPRRTFGCNRREFTGLQGAAAFCARSQVFAAQLERQSKKKLIETLLN